MKKIKKAFTQTHKKDREISLQSTGKNSSEPISPDFVGGQGDKIKKIASDSNIKENASCSISQEMASDYRIRESASDSNIKETISGSEIKERTSVLNIQQTSSNLKDEEGICNSKIQVTTSSFKAEELSEVKEMAGSEVNKTLDTEAKKMADFEVKVTVDSNVKNPTDSKDKDIVSDFNIEKRASDLNIQQTPNLKDEKAFCNPMIKETADTEVKEMAGLEVNKIFEVDVKETAEFEVKVTADSHVKERNDSKDTVSDLKIEQRISDLNIQETVSDSTASVSTVVEAGNFKVEKMASDSKEGENDLEPFKMSTDSDTEAPSPLSSESLSAFIISNCDDSNSKLREDDEWSLLDDIISCCDEIEDNKEISQLLVKNENTASSVSDSMKKVDDRLKKTETLIKNVNTASTSDTVKKLDDRLEKTETLSSIGPNRSWESIKVREKREEKIGEHRLTKELYALNISDTIKSKKPKRLPRMQSTNQPGVSTLPVEERSPAEGKQNLNEDLGDSKHRHQNVLNRFFHVMPNQKPEKSLSSFEDWCSRVRSLSTHIKTITETEKNATLPKFDISQMPIEVEEVPIREMDTVFDPVQMSINDRRKRILNVKHLLLDEEPTPATKPVAEQSVEELNAISFRNYYDKNFTQKRAWLTDVIHDRFTKEKFCTSLLQSVKSNCSQLTETPSETKKNSQATNANRYVRKYAARCQRGCDIDALLNEIQIKTETTLPDFLKQVKIIQRSNTPKSTSWQLIGDH